MTFQEKPPWWGGDLQTIRNFLTPNVRALPGVSKDVVIPKNDCSGDQLTATLDTPNASIAGPLIVLIHGLTGSKDSRYMMASSSFHLKHGRQVLRLNLRGAGSSAKTCQKGYHGGHTSDIGDALVFLSGIIKTRGVFLIGYSLGGNILINFLSKTNDRKILGAATVSASIDPEAAALRLMDLRNVIYQARLLRDMKKEHFKRNPDLSDERQQVVSRIKSIYTFDDKVTAPEYGYKDAKDYYFKTNGARKIPNLDIPLLMISAINDPWIPSDSYKKLIDNSPLNIKILLSAGGGHVGFHEKGQEETWYDRQINCFI